MGTACRVDIFFNLYTIASYSNNVYEYHRSLQLIVIFFIDIILKVVMKFNNLLVFSGCCMFTEQ